MLALNQRMELRTNAPGIALPADTGLAEVMLGYLGDAGTIAEYELCSYEDVSGRDRCRVIAYSPMNFSIDQLAKECMSWSKSPHSDNIKQRVFFVMLENEDEALRTEINFIGAQSFEELEELNRRARFLVSINPYCLQAYLAEQARGVMADHRVTAGISWIDHRRSHAGTFAFSRRPQSRIGHRE